MYCIEKAYKIFWHLTLHNRLEKEFFNRPGMQQLTSGKSRRNRHVLNDPMPERNDHLYQLLFQRYVPIATCDLARCHTLLFNWNKTLWIRRSPRSESWTTLPLKHPIARHIPRSFNINTPLSHTLYHGYWTIRATLATIAKRARKIRSNTSSEDHSQRYRSSARPAHCLPDS